MPWTSRADLILCNVPDLLVEYPSTLSNRCTVDQSTPASFASSAAEMPSSPRAALIWAPEIVDSVSIIPYFMD